MGPLGDTRRFSRAFAARASVVVLAIVALALITAPPGDAAAPPVVPSLQPQATAREWSELVRQRRGAIDTLSRTDCRPLRAVFYAPTDWLRLATKLASAASPCASYYVTVPPLTSDKTRLRPDQAWRIRALGPNMHALAEIHMSTWRKWVQANASTWYAAGVEARRRMAQAGYDVALGDGWAVNELSSAVRRGIGTARGDTLEFVRGLHDGDGVLPQARGTVFAVGLGQSSPDLATYKATVQTWLQDAGFWSQLNAYVADWAQEAYGDVRAYAAEGTTPDARRDTLNEYLQHLLSLAVAGPDAVSAARDYLRTAYLPVANAAWQWATKFGWTLVDADEMKDFVSAQTYSMRSAGAASTTGDRLGFAWAPQNLSGQPKGVFSAQAGQLLERLAEAIRDSAESPAGQPGSGACTPPGRPSWCVRSFPGAVLTERWRSFTAWSSSALGFTVPLRTLAAGAVAGPVAVQLQTGRIPTPALQPLTVSLTTTSPAGTFARTPEGPWTRALTLPLGVGATATPPFLYRDTRAGSSIVSAVAPGVGTGSQTLTVLAGEAVSLAVTPVAATVKAGGSLGLTVGGVDVFGNPAVLQRVSWSVARPAVGSVSPADGPATTFLASATASGVTAVRATLSTSTAQLVADARLEVVLPPTMRVASVRQRPLGPRLRVVTRVVDAAGRGVRGAVVLLTVYRDDRRHAALRGRTDRHGVLVLTPKAAAEGCYSTRVRNVGKPGKRWVRGTPANRLCRR